MLLFLLLQPNELNLMKVLLQTTGAGRDSRQAMQSSCAQKDQEMTACTILHRAVQHY